MTPRGHGGWGKRKESKVPCTSPRRPVVCSWVLGCCCSEGGLHAGHGTANILKEPTPALDTSSEATPHMGTTRDKYTSRRPPPAARCPWGTATHGATGSAGTWKSSATAAACSACGHPLHGQGLPIPLSSLHFSFHIYSYLPPTPRKHLRKLPIKPTTQWDYLKRIRNRVLGVRVL